MVRLQRKSFTMSTNQKLAGLNSTMVRLQPRCDWLYVQVGRGSLNSTMVRLQHYEKLNSRFVLKSLSQFHYGSITTCIVLSSIYLDLFYSLNSTMVRLQPFILLLKPASINALGLNSTMVRLQLFLQIKIQMFSFESQFHYGSITTMSVQKLFTEYGLVSLNSTMVRLQLIYESLLNSYISSLNSTMVRLQRFYYGTIYAS